MAFLFAAKPRKHWLPPDFDAAKHRHHSPTAEGFQGLREGFDGSINKTQPLKTLTSQQRRGFAGNAGGRK
ncbi:MAG: hypothetical protein WBI20_08965 [Burkholderiaceae bacterium]